MPDKLTDKEIVKALRSWLEEIRKSRQAYLEKVNEEHYPSMRYEYLLSDTIHEINRLQAENERLKEKISVAKVDELIESCCNDTAKEFAYKLKSLFPSNNEPYQYWEIHEGADNLLKELVGEVDG